MRIENTFVAYARYWANSSGRPGWRCCMRIRRSGPWPGWPWRRHRYRSVLCCVEARAQMAVCSHRLVLVFGNPGPCDRAGPGWEPVHGGSLHVCAIDRDFCHPGMGRQRSAAPLLAGRSIRINAPVGGHRRGAEPRCLRGFDGEPAWILAGQPDIVRHTVEVTTNNGLAYDNLGISLFGQGRMDDAAQCYAVALKINQRRAGRGWSWLLLLQQRASGEAVKMFSGALQPARPVHSFQHGQRARPPQRYADAIR